MDNHSILNTREVPKNGWLPYINTQVKVSDGIASVKWYRKSSSKNILIHASSAHPRPVKVAVVKNMFRTATTMCTGEDERQESLRLASEIASMNGYTVPHTQNRAHANPQRLSRSNRLLPLCIPFISDRVNAAIQRSIVRAQLQNDVMLVSIPNDNIKRQLVRNRLYDTQCMLDNCVICPYGKAGDCTREGVIYQIECRACNSTYIGETGRVLAIRIREHLASKRRGVLTSALGRHKAEEHNGSDYEVKCTILALEKEIAARKALEAFWIHVKNPRMNNRDELPSITSDLLPFTPHCEL